MTSASSSSSSSPRPGTVQDPADAPDRNLALEIVRVTEAAALAAARHVGRGQKEVADGAAVDAMRHFLSSVSMRGVVVIGEGEKDEAPMLFNGEEVGDGTGPECDIAVDPVEGTTLTAKGMADSIAMVAVAGRGAMYDPSAVFYMDKVIVGPEAVDVVDLEAPPGDNVRAVARAKGGSTRDVTVCVLDRPRHEDLVRQVREAGARVRFITDGDVLGGILAGRRGTGVDMVLGVGGTPEAIISACAMSCLGGAIQARLWPKDDDERRRALDAGHDLDRVLHTADLVSGDDSMFVATGITDGTLLRGVRYESGYATTESIVMRSRSGTVRTVVGEHQQRKLEEYDLLGSDGEDAEA